MESSRSGSKIKVLYLDDEEVMRSVVADVCEKLGYNIMVAAEIPDALKILHGGFQADIIVSDYNLRGPDTGLDFFKVLKIEGVEVPFILVSGSPVDVIAEEEKMAGFLGKPFTEEDLVSMVRKVLIGS